MTHEEMVREFHEKQGFPIGAPIDLLAPQIAMALQNMATKIVTIHEHFVKHHGQKEKFPTALLRMRLIIEELGELAKAMAEGDRVEMADALADLEYVVVGTAVTYGIPQEAVFQEVHRSNMTKTGMDEASKGGKGEGFSKADVASIVWPK